MKENSDACARLAAIAPLVRADRTAAMVRARAAACGRHPSTLYAWLSAYERAGGAGLVPGRSDGGRGRSRLAPAVERIVADALEDAAAGGGTVVAAELARTIAGRCRAAGLASPHVNTVRARLAERGLQNAARLAPDAVRAPGADEREAAVASPASARAGFWSASRTLADARRGLRKATRTEATDPALVACAILVAVVTWAIGG